MLLVTNGNGSTVRLGVVGAGYVARAVHLPWLARLDDRFRVVALAEPDPAARADAARRWGITHAYPDHAAVLAEVDAILVCAPPAAHAEIVLDALAAGVHVLVEKPLCLAVEDADRIVAARDRARRIVQVGCMKIGRAHV